MAVALGEDGAGAGVDDADNLVLGGGGKERAVVVPRHAVDRVSVHADVLQELPGRDVPQKNLCSRVN